MSDHRTLVMDWLINGRVGLSSKTMASVSLGMVPDRIDFPYDPADLNRCLLLMQAAPQVRNFLPKLAELSPEWAGLVRHWAEIEASFLEEVGLDWTKGHSEPKTYELMQVARAAKKEGR